MEDGRRAGSRGCGAKGPGLGDQVSGHSCQGHHRDTEVQRGHAESFYLFYASTQSGHGGAGIVAGFGGGWRSWRAWAEAAGEEARAGAGVECTLDTAPAARRRLIRSRLANTRWSVSLRRAASPAAAAWRVTCSGCSTCTWQPSPSGSCRSTRAASGRVLRFAGPCSSLRAPLQVSSPVRECPFPGSSAIS
jgi:hypothetical protein